MNRRYVFTGGPGAGKTATLQVLRVRGFTCVSEVARSVIQCRKSEGLPPRPGASEFARQVFDRDVALYDSQENGVVTFFDRSLLDSLGLLVECDAITITSAMEIAIERPYNREVFYFPPWEEIYSTDDERDQTYEQSVMIAASICDWYWKLGYTMVEVPRYSPDERADFILGRIGN